MANKASAERVAADMQPPNFRAALKLLETTKAKKDKISGINGEIADVYAKVEGHKVHRGAAKVFMALRSKEPLERMEMMRAINGLIDADGWDKLAADLVDHAEGNVVDMRLRVSGDDDDDDGGEDVDDGEEDGDDEDVVDAAAAEVEAMKPVPRKGSRKPASAVESLRPGLSVVRGQDGYNGDNSDLANAGDRPH